MEMQHLQTIQKIVIDNASLVQFTEEFEPVLKILLERDYQIVLMTPDLATWGHWQDCCVVLSGSQEEKLNYLNNQCQDTVWVTDSETLQKECVQKQVLFVHFATPSSSNFAIHCETLKDMVALFDPSELAIRQIAQDFIEQKEAAPQQALIVCVEGAEQCGHVYLVEKLVQQLEQFGQLVQGLDLTDFAHQSWTKTEQGRWIFQEILTPFADNERVLIEEPPLWAVEREIGIFPLFLSPEMILVIWGTFLLSSDLPSKNILLELSEKTATARLFGIDDRENFDPSFVGKYKETEGLHYQNYLQTIDEVIHWRVNFNNFHAFRLSATNAL